MQKPAPVKAEVIQNALGDSLRLRRKDLKLSMQRVADAAGLSVGFISQVERGLTAPSLASLASIARVLGLPLSTLLEQPSDGEELTRGAQREPYAVPGATMSYERLSTMFEGSKLHSVIVHEPPGHRSEPISHAGEEMFYILSGSITVEIERELRILRPGDSIHFDSRRTHSTWNHTDQDVSFLWCGTLNVFSDAPSPIHESTLDQPVPPAPTGKDH